MEMLPALLQSNDGPSERACWGRRDREISFPLGWIGKRPTMHHW